MLKLTVLRDYARQPALAFLLIAGFLLFSSPAAAQDAVANSGDTAWILTATALVLFMTLPGLALFYAGLVRSKNVLSVLMQCFAIACVASIVWLAVGYSLAFSDGGSANAFVGGLSKAFFGNVGRDGLSGTIPESVFMMFQMTFAIITPALIVGAFVERVNFAAVMLFTILWLIVVYAPVCHWVWGGGWLAEQGVADFAGGLVVHATAGVSALVFVKMLGARENFPKDVEPPHNPGMTMIGAAMLWVGWFGFNAGSALGANGDAGMAMLVTHTSAATASLVWMTIEWVKYGRPSLVGIVTGMVAGLATITPAAGSVGPLGAFIIGILAGSICYWAVSLFKNKLKFDDSLDVFAVHGVGGILGTLSIPFLANLGPAAPGLGEQTLGGQFIVQLTGVVAVCAWSAIASIVLLFIIKLITPLRATEKAIVEGLDIETHGERGYRF